MSNICKRAFNRQDVEAHITYSEFNSKHAFDAVMYNSSEGGMYFETDIHIEAGTDLYIKHKNYSAEIHGKDGKDGYRAEVMWCRPVYKPDRVESDLPHIYGVGVRFMVNRCSQCEEKVSYKEIIKTDNLLFLCPHCYHNLKKLRVGMKQCVENYLIGNVL